MHSIAPAYSSFMRASILPIALAAGTLKMPAAERRCTRFALRSRFVLKGQGGPLMATVREEAAPTFEPWKLRIERAAPDQVEAELAQFLRVLNTLGTPLIDGAKVHFVYYDPAAVNVTVAGEF